MYNANWPDPSNALYLPMRTLDIIKLFFFYVALESEALIQVQGLSPVTGHHGKLFCLLASASFVRTPEPLHLSVLKFLVSEAQCPPVLTLHWLQRRVICSLTLRVSFPSSVRPELSWWDLGCALEYQCLQLGRKKRLLGLAV